MYDNGLLKYYPDLATENGCLKIDKLGRLRATSYPDVYKIKIKDEGCFSGLNYFAKFDRELGIDAEVLLSQIAGIMGFETAFYLPCVNKYGMHGVISNDVKIKGCKTMHQHSCDTKVVCSDYKSPYTESKVKTEDIKFDKFFTKEAIVDYINMHYFDVFSCNIDRHDENFFVNTKGVLSLKTPQIQGIKLIDYGISAVYTGFSDNYAYFNGLSSESLNGRDMLDFLKTNEIVNQYVKPEEVAEKYANIDVKEVADDIQDTIGYEVSKSYTQSLQNRFYTLAEELVK